MKKIICNSLLAFTLIFGSVSLPNQKAHGGIIIGVATATIIGPLIGLTLSSAGFFWGIQEDGLNWKAAVLFVLDEKLSNQDMQEVVSKLYPDLEAYLVDEVAQLLAAKSEVLPMNEKGIKDLVLSENDLAPVLNVLAEINPELGIRLRNDLTKPSLVNM